jgi:hypothetical protein
MCVIERVSSSCAYHSQRTLLADSALGIRTLYEVRVLAEERSQRLLTASLWPFSVQRWCLL